MHEYIRDKAVEFICHQWEMNALLENPKLTALERQELQQQAVQNSLELASIIDLYQSPLISFSFRGKIFRCFSELIRHPHFNCYEMEALVKRLFAINETKSSHVIEVENNAFALHDFLKSRLAFFYPVSVY